LIHHRLPRRDRLTRIWSVIKNDARPRSGFAFGYAGTGQAAPQQRRRSPQDASLLMSRVSSTGFEKPFSATRIIARPTFSVVVTEFGNRVFQIG